MPIRKSFSVFKNRIRNNLTFVMPSQKNFTLGVYSLPYFNARLEEEEQLQRAHAIESFGGYSVVKVAGQGGMGTVRVVRTHSHGEKPSLAALKTLRGDLIKNPENAQALLHEAYIMASRRPRGGAAILDIINNSKNSEIHILMKYAQGGSLYDLIRRQNLPLDGKTLLLLELITCINELHVGGILHGDVKPSNILFSIEGNRWEMSISDYGISSKMEDGTPFIGATIPYCAPEQLSEPAKTSADIWSWGVVAWKILTGRTPFEEVVSIQNNTSDSFMMENFRNFLQSYSTPRLPLFNYEPLDNLNDVISQCLSLNPANRPSASDIVSAFRPHITFHFSEKMNAYIGSNPRTSTIRAVASDFSLVIEKNFNWPISKNMSQGVINVSWMSIASEVEKLLKIGTTYSNYTAIIKLELLLGSRNIDGSIIKALYEYPDKDIISVQKSSNIKDNPAHIAIDIPRDFAIYLLDRLVYSLINVVDELAHPSDMEKLSLYAQDLERHGAYLERHGAYGVEKAMHIGQAYILVGDIEKSIEVFSDLALQYPEDYNIQTMLYIAFRTNRDINRALDCLRKINHILSSSNSPDSTARQAAFIAESVKMLAEIGDDKGAEMLINDAIDEFGENIANFNFLILQIIVSGRLKKKNILFKWNSVKNIIESNEESLSISIAKSCVECAVIYDDIEFGMYLAKKSLSNPKINLKKHQIERDYFNKVVELGKRK